MGDVIGIEDIGVGDIGAGDIDFEDIGEDFAGGVAFGIRGFAPPRSGILAFGGSVS